MPSPVQVYCQPARAHEKTARAAGLTRPRHVTHHARASRVRAGPCAPPVRLASARPPADRGHRTVPVHAVWVRDSNLLTFTFLLGIAILAIYILR